MKLTVVPCDCGNPEPHRKLRTEDGRETRGFFSLVGGKRMHGALLDSGEIEQTGKEKAATEQELASCGLPEEDQPMPRSRPPLSRSRPPLSEGVIGALAAELKKFPPAKHRGMVEFVVGIGIVTAEEGERILAFAAAAV